MGLTFLVNLVVFWLLCCPLATLWHEMAHAMAALMLADGHVRVTLGRDGRRWVWSVGRLTFDLGLWSGFVGDYRYERSPRSNRRRALIAAAGPLASLVLLVTAVVLALILRPTSDLLVFPFAGIAVAALAQLVVTGLPMTYPASWPGYAGLPSDGLQVVRALRSGPARRRTH